MKTKPEVKADPPFAAPTCWDVAPAMPEKPWPVQLQPYQKAMLKALCDPKITRLTLFVGRRRAIAHPNDNIRDPANMSATIANQTAKAGFSASPCSAELYLLHKINDRERWAECDGPRDSSGRRCRERSVYWWQNQCECPGLGEWTEPYYACEKHKPTGWKECPACLPNDAGEQPPPTTQK